MMEDYIRPLMTRQRPEERERKKKHHLGKMSLESVYRKGPKRMRSIAPALASLSLSLSLFRIFLGTRCK
jgi:hypothetical protein